MERWPVAAAAARMERHAAERPLGDRLEDPRKPKIYREIVDALVDVCRDGQGQIGPRRVRGGTWNRNASPGFLPDQHEINELLSRLSSKDRDVLAGLLEHQVQVGIFETLKVLEQFRVHPFEDGYEGSPFHDFVGRIADWKWPES